VVDEAAYVQPQDLITSAILPVTAARPNARILMLSSAATASGPFFDVAALGDGGAAGYRTFRWLPRVLGGDCDMPWLSASKIESDRLAMGELRFQAEYLGQFASGLDLLSAPRTCSS
jgi:hypothetical protein